MPNELTSDAVRFSTMTPGDRKALINGTTGGPATNQIQSPVGFFFASFAPECSDPVRWNRS